MSKATTESRNNKTNNKNQPTLITIPFTNKSYTKIEITRILIKLLPRETHKLHTNSNINTTTPSKKKKKSLPQKIIYNCFKANISISIIKDYFHFANTYDVIVFGRLLQNCNIIHCIIYENDENNAFLFDDNNVLFRLQPFHTPNILNSFILIDSNEIKHEQNQDEDDDDDIFKIIHEIYKSMQHMEQKIKDRNGNINYTKIITNNSKFDLLQENICQLQIVPLHQLRDDNDDTKIISFFINIYNIIIKYAFWKLGIPTSMYQRHAFYETISMNIGGYDMSLNYIYHTILRCNNNTPTATNHNNKLSSAFNEVISTSTRCITMPTNKDDNLLHKLPLEKLDPRVHFALIHTPIPMSNIPFYTCTMIYDQLQTSVTKFCEQFKNTFLDEDSFTIHLNMIFKWYKNDFVSLDNNEYYNDEDFLENVLLSYLQGKKKNLLLRMIKKQKDKDIDIDIKYMPFDWDYYDGSIITDKKIFDKDSMLSDRYTLLGKMNALLFK